MPHGPEDLARLIDRARRECVPLDPSSDDWIGLSPSEAQEVASRLYALWGGEASPYWKLGAIDEATQRRLGVTGPICAPLDPHEVSVDCVEFTLPASRYIKAKFEAEIGVRVGEQGLTAMPCVEVADSRFIDWRLPAGGVVADGALQGGMVFGPDRPPPAEVTVVVRHDGRVLCEARGDWGDAAGRLAVLPLDAGASHVATGSLTPLFDVVTGWWEFDFGDLGLIHVTVP